MAGDITIEELHKEMDLIQGCISRMADNSFRLKEYYIVLMAGILAVLLSRQCEGIVVGVFLLVVTGVFWGLDAFFLKMETLFRWKYEWVIEKRKAGEKNYLYNLNPHNKNMWLDAESKNTHFVKFLWNKTLVPYYGGVIGIIILLLVIMKMAF